MLAAMERFEEYAHKAAHLEPVFKQVGMQMILLAKEEPKLYQLIFMYSISEAQTFDDIYAHLGSIADECLDVLQKDYDLSKDNAKRCSSTYGFTPSVSALCAPPVCAISLMNRLPRC